MRPSRRRPRLRWWIPALLLVFLAPAIYSWTRMAMLPSSLPLGVRTVEWLRMHHLNWLVDEAEHVYYTWQTPAKGGPQLKTLPAVGLHAGREGAREGRVAAAHPAGLRPSTSRRGSLEVDWAAGGRTPSRAGDDVPDRARLPAHRRVRRLVRPPADGARLLPRSVRAAECDAARPDAGPLRPALAAARDLQQRLHLQRRPER